MKLFVIEKSEDGNCWDIIDAELTKTAVAKCFQKHMPNHTHLRLTYYADAPQGVVNRVEAFLPPLSLFP